MPARELQEQLNALREQLEQNPPLSLEEREHLQELMQQIELQLKLETSTHDASLAARCERVLTMADGVIVSDTAGSKA